MIAVQFSDETMTKINILFLGGPLPEEFQHYYPNYAEIDDDDPRIQEYLHPTPTAAEILAAKQAIKDQKIRDASISMAPVMVSLQLDGLTDEGAAKAREWQDYYLALQSVDLSEADPAWPEPPEA